VDWNGFTPRTVAEGKEQESPNQISSPKNTL
jgi:hypothetical protein